IIRHRSWLRSNERLRAWAIRCTQMVQDLCQTERVIVNGDFVQCSIVSQVEIRTDARALVAEGNNSAREAQSSGGHSFRVYGVAGHIEGHVAGAGIIYSDQVMPVAIWAERGIAEGLVARRIGNEEFVVAACVHINVELFVDTAAAAARAFADQRGIA